MGVSGNWNVEKEERKSSNIGSSNLISYSETYNEKILLDSRHMQIKMFDTRHQRVKIGF